jgi:hypothetical protein
VAQTKQVAPDDMAELLFTRGAIDWVRNDRARAIENWEAVLRVEPGHAGATQWLATARGQVPPPTGR